MGRHLGLRGAGLDGLSFEPGINWVLKTKERKKNKEKKRKNRSAVKSDEVDELLTLTALFLCNMNVLLLYWPSV